MYLENLSIKYMRLGFIWGQAFRCLPYRWDKKSKRPYVTKSKFHWLMYILLLVERVSILYVYTVRIFSSQDHNGKEKYTHVERFLLMLFSVSPILNLALQICALSKLNIIPKQYKATLKLDEYFQDNFGSRKQRQKWAAEAHKLGKQFSSTQQAANLMFLGLIPILLHPSHPLNPIIGSPDDPIWKKICMMSMNSLLMIHGYISTCSINMVLGNGFQASIFVAHKIMDQMSLDMESEKYCTRQSLRYPHGFYKCYTMLEVLLKQLNDSYGWSMGIGYIGSLEMTSFWLYGLVRAESVPLTIAALSCLAVNVHILLEYLPNVGRINEKSVELLRSWKQQRKTQFTSILFKKQLKSLHPLRLCVGGSLYYADSGLVLTAMTFVLSKTAELLTMESVQYRNFV